MNRRGEVLVAIMNDQRDIALAQQQHWYRIPVSSAAKWLKNQWPLHWIALYMTKQFSIDAHAVPYNGRVIEIRTVNLRQLFPNEAENPKSNRRYYQLIFDPLQELPRPILSRRCRRNVSFPTTWQKFANTVEINDLYEGSPLEDQL